MLGAHPGSGYKMQLLYRVLRVKLNTPKRRQLKSCLHELGNLLLDWGTLGLKSAERIKTRDKFLISYRPGLTDRPRGTAVVPAAAHEAAPQPFSTRSHNKRFGW